MEATDERQGEPIQRLSRVMKSIISALYADAPEWVSSNDLIDMPGIGAASFYPTIRRLRRSPWVEWRWEHPRDDPQGKPYMTYRLRPVGVELGGELAAGRLKGRAWQQFVPSEWTWVG